MDTLSPAVWKEQEERDDATWLKPYRGSGGGLQWTKEVKISTTLLDSAVVKLCFGISGVAPGSVLVIIWITAVVFCQIGLRIRPWVYPGKSHRSIKDSRIWSLSMKNIYFFFIFCKLMLFLSWQPLTNVVTYWMYTVHTFWLFSDGSPTI